MTLKLALNTLTFLGAALVCFASNAEPVQIIKSTPLSEIWLNPGFYTYHFQKNKGLNNDNFGFGGEYRYSNVASVELGIFDNSNRQTSHYVGWNWQPIGLGPMRFGAVVAAIDGYPAMRNGNWFIAAIPTASIEYKNIGANLLFIPGYKDKVYSAISLQLKLKVY